MIEVEVSCEYIKNVCFDYVAKFPLQRLKTMRSLSGNDTKRPFHELDYNVICLDLLCCDVCLQTDCLNDQVLK